MQEKKKEKWLKSYICGNAAPVRINLQRAGGLQSASPEKLIMGKDNPCMALKASVGPRGVELSLSRPIPAVTAPKNVQTMLSHPTLTIPDETF